MALNRSLFCLGFIVLVLLFVGFSIADPNTEGTSGKPDSSSQSTASSGNSNDKTDGSKLDSNTAPVHKENKSGDPAKKQSKESNVDGKSKNGENSVEESQKKHEAKKDSNDSSGKSKETETSGKEEANSGSKEHKEGAKGKRNGSDAGSLGHLDGGKDTVNKGNSESLAGKQGFKENENQGNSQNVDQKVEPKQKENEKNSVVSSTKENSYFDDCDPSSRCMDEGKKIIACLKVRGESPDYSLIIQNKGKVALSVEIAAPDFVHLEETKIKNLHDKKDVKVTISSGSGGNNNLIVLNAGHGKCNLNISNLIAHNSGKENEGLRKFNYINFMSSPRTPIIAVACFAALLILGSSWMCISRFHRKQVFNNETKYQRIDMVELPVSDRGKSESKADDGWDDNWGDDWDDEETPSTPSFPVTPSVSAKGLASRRLNKDAWKD